ncbi:MAG TPA: TMEM175 family protein [Gemmatimonadales bacterium]|nr:TMEM175 family protein [Gemmatimonadales bacterium]
MNKQRLEAFSDGVIAIIITIMVLELHEPQSAEWSALRPLTALFLSYVLSFVVLGIYWNNHHHLFQASRRVSGRVLWANLHLLFWLSLIPFGTAWMGVHEFARAPVALYGGILLLAGMAYNVLAKSLVKLHGADSVIARAVGDDRKGLASLLIYSTAVLIAFVAPKIAFALYVLVAIMWLVPDPRIETRLAAGAQENA